MHNERRNKNMTTTLKSNITARLNWAWRDRSGTLPIVDANRLDFDLNIDSGEQSGQCNAVWHDEGLTLASGETLVLYLDRLVRTLFGNNVVISFNAVKALLIIQRGAAATSGSLLIGGASLEEWSEPFGAVGDTLNLPPNSPLLLSNVGTGWSVTETSNALALQAIGGPVEFDVAVLGVSPDVGSSSSSSSSSSS
jgi:hypothetical protein